MARKRKWYQRALYWLVGILLPPVMTLILRLIYLTLRWDMSGREHLRPFWDEGRPVIIAFWHGRLLLCPKGWEKKGKSYVLIGANRNGELITRIIRSWGIGAVRGGSREGGEQAREEMARIHQQAGGKWVTLAFTPDGPHGPRYVSKAGMAKVSRDLDMPIIWLSTGANPSWRVNIWDLFMVPAPFGKAKLTWAPPIDPRDYLHLDLEAYRDEVDRLGRAHLGQVDLALGILHPDDRALLTPDSVAKH